jgi:hypothetical protein
MYNVVYRRMLLIAMQSLLHLVVDPAWETPALSMKPPETPQKISTMYIWREEEENGEEEEEKGRNE